MTASLPHKPIVKKRTKKFWRHQCDRKKTVPVRRQPPVVYETRPQIIFSYADLRTVLYCTWISCIRTDPVHRLHFFPRPLAKHDQGTRSTCKEISSQLCYHCSTTDTHTTCAVQVEEAKGY